jgi:hypothetical protein
MEEKGILVEKALGRLTRLEDNIKLGFREILNREDEVKNGGAIPPTSPYIFMISCLIN